jgi:signal transduction histidine kinase
MCAEITAPNKQDGALRFLLIEDNPLDVELIEHQLQRASFEFTFAVVRTPEDFKRELRTTPPHVVIADYNLPDWTGMQGLEILVREKPDIPFILVTGALGDLTAVDCIKLGATDYVLKDALARLPVAIRRALEEKRLREQRDEAQKDLEQGRQNQLRLKDEFLSHVTHEIRSPLAVIIQLMSIMLDGLAGEISQEQREYDEIVLTNARQMLSMINALTQVTRLENEKLTVEPESCSVSDAVSDTLDALNGNARAGGVNLSCQLPSGLPMAYADATRVRQILFNLVDNGIKFTSPGGIVEINARPWGKDSEFLCIEVSDTGCGIEPQNIGKIFERLYQTLDDCRPGKSLGLGLFISKELVMLQGGEIWVASELQKGSSFSFTLPITDNLRTKSDKGMESNNPQLMRPSRALSESEEK